MKDFFRKIAKALFGNYQWVVDFTESITRRDVKAHRGSAMWAYVIFFAPLIFAEGSSFARFHANQSMINLILSTVVAGCLGMIPVVGPVLLPLQEVLCLVWAVRGIILAKQGKAVSIPLVGWITLLAYRTPDQA